MSNKEITNTEAINLISRNKSVFKYDPEMTKALNIAIKAIERDSKVDHITFHWNDEKNNFVAACNAFEDILEVYGRGRQ